MSSLYETLKQRRQSARLPRDRPAYLYRNPPPPSPPPPVDDEEMSDVDDIESGSVASETDSEAVASASPMQTDSDDDGDDENGDDAAAASAAAADDDDAASASADEMAPSRVTRQRSVVRPTPVSHSIGSIFWPKHAHEDFGALERLVKNAFPSKLKPALASLSPPVVVLDEFLSQKQVDAMMKATESGKWNASPQEKGTGAALSDQEREDLAQRTSKSMYFPQGSSPAVSAVEHKAMELIGISAGDMRHYLEPLQVVRYTAGQEFQIHHDSGTWEEGTDTVEAIAPIRSFTLLVYLTDIPDGGGGETVFPEAVVAGGQKGISVRPRRGRAVFWANTDANGVCDVRTVHLAKPILGDNVKAAINVWYTHRM